MCCSYGPQSKSFSKIDGLKIVGENPSLGHYLKYRAKETAYLTSYITEEILNTIPGFF
ncbi:hypothetical protein EDD73_13525 [Heliophilum fasciatum]|uniref:Uncharacterized protein n=1 Tax=Heliophilum fasciatum TaxID=35700 RepID=A0A4R2RF03_9FIRM|nr:hypothetical protein [Heliophilum fasciatum]TCP60637.1 hypothetical protein EDD73_13525 [Heliophilum fasciatum]